MYTQEISSLQHPIVKHLVKVRQDRSYRSDVNTVLISGIKLVTELSSLYPFKTLLIAEGYTPPIPLTSERCYAAPISILKKVTGLNEPEPIAAEIALPPRAPFCGITRLLVLDGISDPGNVGTLFRTALAMNWDAIFLTPHTSDPFNDKALRAAKGATFKLPFQSGSYEELLSLVQQEGLHLVIADAHAKESSHTHLPVALVLGNESHGASLQLKSQGTGMSISINPAIESLNVAAAGAILMDRLSRGSHV